MSHKYLIIFKWYVVCLVVFCSLLHNSCICEVRSSSGVSPNDVIAFRDTPKLFTGLKASQIENTRKASRKASSRIKTEASYLCINVAIQHLALSVCTQNTTTSAA